MKEYYIKVYTKSGMSYNGVVMAVDQDSAEKNIEASIKNHGYVIIERDVVTTKILAENIDAFEISKYPFR